PRGGRPLEELAGLQPVQGRRQVLEAVAGDLGPGPPPAELAGHGRVVARRPGGRRRARGPRWAAAPRPRPRRRVGRVASPGPAASARTPRRTAGCPRPGPAGPGRPRPATRPGQGGPAGGPAARGG